MRWLLNLKVEELDAQNKVRQVVEGELRIDRKMRNNNDMQAGLSSLHLAAERNYLDIVRSFFI